MSRVEVLSIEQSLALSDLLTADDLAFIDGFSSERRRREVAAWRSLLRSVVVEMDFDGSLPIAYDSVGAPYFVGGALFFSVSHSRTHIAVVISERKCAIDIESLDRDFERIAARYVSDSERVLLLNSGIDSSVQLPLLWCAKEAMYKFSGRQGLDLIHDLVVREVTSDSIDNMHWSLFEGHLLVWGC